MSDYPNMGYCMFENTVQALKQCIESEACENIDPVSVLSEGEATAFKRLVQLCRQFADDYGYE